MPTETISGLVQQIIDGRALSRDQARWLTRLAETQLSDLFAAASRIRDHYVGQRARCCSIVASKVGRCSEDCAFCCQSAHYDTPVQNEITLDDKQIMSAARDAARNGARAFGIVNSGLGPTDEEVERWGRTIRELRKASPLQICASLGLLTAAQARRLRSDGCQCYNHNLQTSRRHFPRIVSTHRYEDRLDTLRQVKLAGMHLCSGALFGMGESWEDRVDLAMELRELEPDVVPLNFLIPIEGTPLATSALMSPMECLKIIAIYRFLFPRQEIKVAGGREVNLRDQQNRIFEAGADSFLIGNYLTTCGRAPEEDRRMVQEAGLTLEGPNQTRSPQAISASESFQHAIS